MYVQVVGPLSFGIMVWTRAIPAHYDVLRNAIMHEVLAFVFALIVSPSFFLSFPNILEICMLKDIKRDGSLE